MSETLIDLDLPPAFPDRTQLPESDGTFVKNFQEHPQSIILTILKNRQDACSTTNKFFCGTGILPVHKKLIENGAISQI